MDEEKKENIILTGFMGTGKTTVGALLAIELGYRLVDTDVLIEAQSGRAIPDIFADLGEAAFRQLERDVAVDLAKKEGLVISTGGRMMLDAENVRLLEENGRIFCLYATPDVILERVMGDEKGIERPLLKGADPSQRIRELLEERQEKYNQFTQINTINQTPEQVMQAILEKVQNSGSFDSDPEFKSS